MNWHCTSAATLTKSIFMKHIIRIAGLIVMQAFLASCATQDGSYMHQGTKLEDAQNKDSRFNSALPNGAPDTPPSQTSAAPNGYVGSDPF